MGYRPNLNAPIAAKLATASLMVQSQAKKGTVKQGSKVKLIVGLFVTSGHKLGGEGNAPVVIKLEGPEGFEFPEGEKTFNSLSEARKVLQMQVKVGKKVEKGDHQITVKISFQPTAADGKTGKAQEISVKLPITVR